MRGADNRCSVVELCKYLKHTLLHTQHLSVASVTKNSNSPTASVLKADSGASKHFIRDNDSKHLKNIKALLNGPVAKLPDNKYIRTSSTGLLPFEEYLSEDTKQALIYPDLKNASLLSIGQLCDDNCLALFTKYFLWIIKITK